MANKNIYCAGNTKAVRFAEHFLRSKGFHCTSQPQWDAGHLLLDIPSFRDAKTLRSGGSIDTLLESLPKEIIIWGGNLKQSIPDGYKTVDLLEDEIYLAKNAAITADCALQIASPLLNTTWKDTSALVIGWGRIGKCLATLLDSLGCTVTVASQNLSSRAVLEAAGFHTADSSNISGEAAHNRIVFNTVPRVMIPAADAPLWEACIKIDLASQKGIEGNNVIWAKGLPGIHAPESSGKLIAETVARLWKECNF